VRRNGREMENCLGKPKPTSSSDDIVCCGQVHFKTSDLQPFGQKFLFGIQFVVGGVRLRNKSVKY
jgi:hypothetical protein